MLQVHPLVSGEAAEPLPFALRLGRGRLLMAGFWLRRCFGARCSWARAALQLASVQPKLLRLHDQLRVVVFALGFGGLGQGTRVTLVEHV